MEYLETTHPEVYETFLAAFHVVRTTDNFWASLSCDLVIEKEFMRNIKSTDGLTRGRGMTEVQRHLWVQSMVACTEMNSAMQQFTGVIYQSSDQHKESFVARQIRDSKDVDKVLLMIRDISPFVDDASLRNITS